MPRIPAPAAPAPRDWPCVVAHGDGTLLAVHVVPHASRTGCAGLHGDALRVRLAAPPVDGRANEALLAWLAVELAVPRRAVALRAGASARAKRIAIDLEPARVRAWLDARGCGD